MPKKNARAKSNPPTRKTRSTSAGRSAERVPSERKPAWTFLSNHAHVLLLLAKEPDILLKDVAIRVGITERAVQRIVAELEADSYIERERIGRCNRYKVHPELPLRHPIEAHRRIASLIALVIDA